MVVEQLRAAHRVPCFSWLNPGQIDIHSEAFGPLQPAVVGILNIEYEKRSKVHVEIYIENVVQNAIFPWLRPLSLSSLSLYIYICINK